MKAKLFAKRVRAKRGTFSYRAVGDLLGMAQTTICRIEKGNQPDMASFEKLCGWMGADPREFLEIPTVTQPAEPAADAAVRKRRVARG